MLYFYVFRRVVQLKDNLYNSYIVREHLILHLARCFRANGPRYNLLNSALLELFEFIRTEEINTLLTDVCENYFDYFADVKYVKTFTALKLRLVDSLGLLMHPMCNVLHYILYRYTYMYLYLLFEIVLFSHPCFS